jgi:LPS-assembly protein
MRVQTDALDIYDVETPQGSTRKLVASGHVVFLRREERLMGDELTMDLNTGKGTIENAVGNMDPGIYFRAKTLDRLDPRTFVVHEARFSSCCQPNPRWGFRASSAKLHTGDKIVAKNVLFTVGVPVWPKSLPTPLYFPYFAYPLTKDDRATGLLIPSFSYSRKRGMDVRMGFFWAMGRSADQTFTVERRAVLPPRISHELRYLREDMSQGTFRTTLFPPRKAVTEEQLQQLKGLPPPNLDRDYDLQWRAVQALPGSLVAKVHVNRTSPQDFLTSPDRMYDRHRDLELAVQGLIGRQNLLVKADEQATLSDQDQKALNRYLPQLRLSMAPRRLGGSGVVADYALQVDRLQRAPKATDQERRTDTWSRLDILPSISRPVSLAFLTLTPAVRMRYTRYSATYPYDQETRQQTTANGPSAGAFGRRYTEASLEMEGPSFSRVFVNPTAIFSDKFKHVLSPEVTWLVRSENAGTESLPVFDSIDKANAAHQITYGIRNRFYSRRRQRGRQPTPYEFLSWYVYQVYYIDTPKSATDPAFIAGIGEPGGTMVHHSPIGSRILFQPLPGWNLDWRTEYDTKVKQTRYTSLDARLGGSLGAVDVRWNRSMRAPNKGTELKLADNALAASASIRLFDRTIELGGTSTYSFPSQLYLDRSLFLRFRVQCFGFMIQWLQRCINGEQVPSIAFSIDLANLGSIGMDPQRQPGRAGY